MESVIVCSDMIRDLMALHTHTLTLTKKLEARVHVCLCTFHAFIFIYVIMKLKRVHSIKCYLWMSVCVSVYSTIFGLYHPYLYKDLCLSRNTYIRDNFHLENLLCLPTKRGKTKTHSLIIIHISLFNVDEIFVSDVVSHFHCCCAPPISSSFPSCNWLVEVKMDKYTNPAMVELERYCWKLAVLLQ